MVKRGEALANLERELIIHFQISKAAALYVKALFGGVRRALEIFQESGFSDSSHRVNAAQYLLVCVLESGRLRLVWTFGVENHQSATLNLLLRI